VNFILATRRWGPLIWQNLEGRRFAPPWSDRVTARLATLGSGLRRGTATTAVNGVTYLHFEAAYYHAFYGREQRDL
jgi:hypothetical protein